MQHALESMLRITVAGAALESNQLPIYLDSGRPLSEQPSSTWTTNQHRGASKPSPQCRGVYALPPTESIRVPRARADGSDDGGGVQAGFGEDVGDFTVTQEGVGQSQIQNRDAMVLAQQELVDG